jgi:haloalkane dehalogenase
MITAPAPEAPKAAATKAPPSSPPPPWLDRDAYPFPSRWFALPEGRLHYLDEGPGGRAKTVLFVHGTPTWSFEYRHLIRDLARTHRCVAVDHLGFGLSDRPRDAGYAPEDHSRRLQAFADGLGLHDVTLVAHDFGGPISLPLALATPGRVSRLVLLNTWMWSFDDDTQMRRRARMVSGAVGRFLYRRLNASLRLITPRAYGDRRKLTPEIHRQYLAVFPDAASRERVLWALARALTSSASFYDGLWRRRAELAAIPALIVWGMRDSAFPPRSLDRWRQALPHAEVVALPEAGHWPHEEDPQAVLAAIRARI